MFRRTEIGAGANHSGGPVDVSTRNLVLAKAVKVLGICEVVSRIGISETLVRTYAIGDLAIPDPIWLLTVKCVLARISSPGPHPGNLL